MTDDERSWPSSRATCGSSTRVWSPTRARDAIVSHLVRAVGARRPVWVGINHANARSRALELRTQFDARYAVLRPMHPAVYLRVGPGGLCAFVAPVHRLPKSIAP